MKQPPPVLASQPAIPLPSTTLTAAPTAIATRAFPNIFLSRRPGHSEGPGTLLVLHDQLQWRDGLSPDATSVWSARFEAVNLHAIGTAEASGGAYLLLQLGDDCEEVRFSLVPPPAAAADDNSAVEGENGTNGVDGAHDLENEDNRDANHGDGKAGGTESADSPADKNNDDVLWRLYDAFCEGVGRCASANDGDGNDTSAGSLLGMLASMESMASGGADCGDGARDDGNSEQGGAVQWRYNAAVEEVEGRYDDAEEEDDDVGANFRADGSRLP